MSKFTSVYLCLDADVKKEFLANVSLLAAELSKSKLELYVLGHTSNSNDKLTLLSYPKGEYFSTQERFASRVREVAGVPENLLILFYYAEGSPYLFETDNSYVLPLRYFKEKPSNVWVYDFSTESPIKSEILLKPALTPPRAYPLTFPEEIPPGCQKKDYLYISYILLAKLLANSPAKVGTYAPLFEKAKKDPVQMAEVGVTLIEKVKKLSEKIYGPQAKTASLLARFWAKLKKEHPLTPAATLFAQMSVLEEAVLAKEAGVALEVAPVLPQPVAPPPAAAAPAPSASRPTRKKREESKPSYWKTVGVLLAGGLLFGLAKKYGGGGEADYAKSEKTAGQMFQQLAQRAGDKERARRASIEEGVSPLGKRSTTEIPDFDREAVRKNVVDYGKKLEEKTKAEAEENISRGVRKYLSQVIALQKEEGERKKELENLWREVNFDEAAGEKLWREWKVNKGDR